MVLIPIGVILAIVVGVLAWFFHRRHVEAGRTWRDNTTIIK